VAYPNQRRKLEQAYGEPIEQLLPRLANEHGSIPKLAKALGLSKVTVYGWAKEIGLTQQPCFTVRGKRKKKK
jgi:hypothetical protein